MSYSYVEFEDRFRGAYGVVREEQEKYVPFFAAVQRPVVDLGCGRGEFLSLLREAGIPSWGVDSHPEMVRAARARGLDVRQDGLLEHLEGQRSGSLGGIFMCHVIEHLPRRDVLRLVELAGDRLAPGGVIVIETLNPQCVFSYAPFSMDFTHEWPIHPQTLQFLLEAHGFEGFEIMYRQYLPPAMLELVDGVAPPPSTPFEAQVAQALQKLQTIVDVAFKNFIYAVAARTGDDQNAAAEDSPAVGWRP